ncbi:hypothetical protein C8A00DRAFT_29422 [Chaetomidium leptoderma]|uniref:FAD-binding FR-type domain-containing protein n=1 Tax=Chaetomidium leptoderma TaxID=669021 RepID=A0AAN6VUJ1_9PEZI|nr:hypothetical protein C8A00DRAFT_29422 [Chaetomidium leptoderma]
MSKQSHIERTANEPRDPTLHTLTISDITQINPTVRLIRLNIPPNDSITFLPGQFVDLHLPPSAQVPKPGGFTITSAPSLALPPPKTHAHTALKEEEEEEGEEEEEEEEPQYLELAIQSSPKNPAAAYLFLPTAQLLNTPVQVRIGGSFVFPPPPPPLITTQQPQIQKVVLVAGGMGINPLMSMLSFIGEQQQQQRITGVAAAPDYEVRVLYSVGDPGLVYGGGVGVREGGGILFLERIASLFRDEKVRGGLELFLTGQGSFGEREGGVVRCSGGVDVPFLGRRMTVRDVEGAVGGDKEAAVVYVCGVPGMTDEFVEALVSPEGFGMDKRRVLFEKWW